MYVPEQYKELNLIVINDFINQNSFGNIITSHNNELYVTPTPFIATLNNNSTITLLGHVSKHNPQVISLVNGASVLCSFNGPHCYISPSWYTTPNVPTWNYKAVQVKGIVKILDAKAAQKTMETLVQHYEQGVEKPLKITDIPYDMLNEDLANIVVFEIEVHSVDASFKLSQNKDDVTYTKIIRELKKQDDYNSMLIAFEMEQNLKKRKLQAN